MTLLNELVDGASRDDVTVTTLLNQLKVLAARTRVGELADWVEHELVGYPNEVTLPSYRGPFASDVRGDFVAMLGADGLKSAPIGPGGFEPGFREQFGRLFEIEFRQSIAEIIELSRMTDSVQSTWSADMVMYVNQLLAQEKAQLYDPSFRLQRAWRPVPPFKASGVVAAVRTRILDLALELEQEYPDAGQRGEEQPPADEVRSMVINNIFGGNVTVAAGAGSTAHQEINVRPQDRDSLRAYLQSLGLNQQDLDGLETALDEDGDKLVDGEPGPATKSWLWRMTTGAGSMAKNAVTAGLGGLLGQALAAYFGIAT